MELLGRLDEINKKLIVLKNEKEQLSSSVVNADTIKKELEDRLKQSETELKLAKDSKALALKKLDSIIEKLV